MKKRLVLDLDMTLLYSDELERENEDAYIEAEGRFYYLWFRPWVKEFLAFAFANFEVHLCTSAKLTYTLNCLNALKVSASSFKSIVTQEQLSEAVVFNGYSDWNDFIKSWDDAIVVDDKDYIYRGSNLTILKVNPYFPSPKDQELLRVKSELEKILKGPNEI